MVKECVEAADGREALKIIDSDAGIDLVLCDVVMPQLDGFEVVKEVRAKAHLADLPVILLTGEESIGQKVRGLSIGASDYVTKPFNAQELLARVKIQLRLKALQDELRQLSITDPLTHLYNRRYFLEELERELGRSRHLGLQMGFAITDIDHFKGINDRHGHLVGTRRCSSSPRTFATTADRWIASPGMAVRSSSSSCPTRTSRSVRPSWNRCARASRPTISRIFPKASRPPSGCARTPAMASRASTT
jgi:CheY-like chemotaxis protein